jgi:hypothetical protein
MIIMSTYYLSAIADEVAASAELVELGASPAELDCNPESFRPHSMINHAGCPEMDLTQVYDLAD